LKTSMNQVSRTKEYFKIEKPHEFFRVAFAFMGGMQERGD